MMRRILSWAVLALCLAAFAHADQVILKNGAVRTGKVISDDDSGVKINLGKMTITLPRDQIERVILETPTPAATPSETPEPSGIEVYKSPTPQPTYTPMPTIAANTAAANVGSATSPGNRERFGVLTSVKGKVRLKRAGGDWEEARVGQIIYFGDQIETAGGRIQVVEQGKWDIRTLEGTSILPFKDERGPGVDLFEGKVWQKIEKLQTEGGISYRVRTPNAIAGVRGTLFAVQHKPKGDSRIAVFEGEVEAAGQDASEAVIANKAAVFQAGSKFIGLSPAPPEEKDEWDFWDKWQAEVEAIGRQFPIGGSIIAGMGAQIAAENKLAEQMLQERKQAVMVNQVAEALDQLKAGILRYQQDFGALPPENLFWQSLRNNLGGTPQWKGPYIPAELMFPIKDRFGTDIRVEIVTSPEGNRYMRLISAGPNKLFDDGKADDIISIVTRLESPNPEPPPTGG